MNEWNLIVFFELLKYFGPSKMSLSLQLYSQTVLLDLELWKIGTMRHSVNFSIGVPLMDSWTFGKNPKNHLTQAFNRLDFLLQGKRGCDKNGVATKQKGLRQKRNKGGIISVVFSCNIPVLSETSLWKLSEVEGISCS